MSKKTIILSGLLGVVASGAVCGEIDLKDFDDDSMRDMDTAIKDLEPVIGAKNAAAAHGDAQVLRDGFRETEDYFSKKGAADAVEFARKSAELTTTVLHDIAENNFDAAANSARALSTSCRTCHDVYKPLTK